MPHVVEKVGLITVRNGRVLLCRKRTLDSALILPGGKPERGEEPEACLARELCEELGSSVFAISLSRVGRYRHRAAHDDPSVEATVDVTLFLGTLVGVPQPAAEIRELVWFGPNDDWMQLAPSLREAIFPDLCARGLLDWRLPS